MTEGPLSPAAPKENLRASQILCLALMAGSLVFAIIISIIIATQGPSWKGDKEFATILFYVAIGIGFLISILALSRYNKDIKSLKNSTGSLSDKLNQYRSVLILYMARCEGAAIFSIIALYLTGNFYFLGIVVVMLGLMLSRFPFKPKVIKELGLDWKEQQELE